MQGYNNAIKMGFKELLFGKPEETFDDLIAKVNAMRETLEKTVDLGTKNEVEIDVKVDETKKVLKEEIQKLKDDADTEIKGLIAKQRTIVSARTFAQNVLKSFEQPSE